MFRLRPPRVDAIGTGTHLPGEDVPIYLMFGLAHFSKPGRVTSSSMRLHTVCALTMMRTAHRATGRRRSESSGPEEVWSIQLAVRSSLTGSPTGTVNVWGVVHAT